MKIVGHTIEYCRPGIETSEPVKPGDWILTRAEGAVTGALISFGQNIRYMRTPGDYDFWTHAAMLQGHLYDLFESLEWGVTESNLKKYKDHHYAVIRIDASDEQRRLMVGFFEDVLAERHGRNRYDYLAVGLLIPLQLLTGGKWAFARSNTLICSGAVAEALVKTLTSFFRPPTGMMPADLAFAYGVPGPGAK